jgi:hypothetical protein
MYQGDYIPSAPVNDEARERNGNLPGMGGVFNYVNFHVYHYSANNPVNYVDPDGKWVFSLGIGATGGGSTGGHVSVGISIGYSKKEGISIGAFRSIAGGSYVGAGGSLTINATISPSAQSVHDIAGESLIIGGSGGEGIVAGGDLIISMDDKNVSFSGNIGVGGGLLGEGHSMYATTKVSGTYLNEVARNIDNAINENIIYPIIDQILQPYY